MAWIVKRHLKTGVFWYVRYSVHGRKGWLSAGRSRLSAVKIRDKIATEMAEGRFLDKKSSSDWTLGQLKKLYLERMQTLKPRSARWREQRFTKLEAVIGATTPIESILPETVDKFIHARLLEGRAASTVKGEVAILRHALRMAHRWQGDTGLSEYRLEVVSLPKAHAARKPVFLTRRQVRALLRAGKAWGGHPYLLLRVFLTTAARPGEILKLQPPDIRRKAIWFGTLKDGADRLAPVPKALANELRRSLPFEGSGEAKDRYKRFWRDVRKGAGLSHIRPYDLRHTAISAMLERGVPPRMVQRIVGHRQFQTTEKYAHFAKDYELPEPLEW